MNLKSVYFEKYCPYEVGDVVEVNNTIKVVKEICFLFYATERENETRILIGDKENNNKDKWFLMKENLKN